MPEDTQVTRRVAVHTHKEDALDMVLRAAADLYNHVGDPGEKVPLSWLAPMLNLSVAIDECVATGIMHIESE